MALSFWIYAILFIVVVVLIFKFIKKIVAAIFTVIFLVILIVAGVGGLVYMDYKSIMDQDNYNVNLIYGAPNDLEFGLSFLMTKGEDFDKDSVSSLDVSKIDEIFLDDLEDEDGFYIFVSEEIYEDVLSDNGSYYLPGTEDLNIMAFDLDTELSKSEVLEILASKDSNKMYLDIVLGKNDFPSVPGVNPEEFAQGLIDEQLGEITIREALFAASFSELETVDYVILFEGFKDDEVLVYPQRFSFGIVKLLPAETIAEKLS